jgi:hypothetical protein
MGGELALRCLPTNKRRCDCWRERKGSRRFQFFAYCAYYYGYLGRYYAYQDFTLSGGASLYSDDAYYDGYFGQIYSYEAAIGQ